MYVYKYLPIPMSCHHLCMYNNEKTLASKHKIGVPGVFLDNTMEEEREEAKEMFSQFFRISSLQR